jgi:acetyl esterase/lipase
MPEDLKPSSQLTALVEQARTRKAMLSSNYDLREMRALALAATDAETAREASSGGGLKIERRGTADGACVIVFVPGGGYFLPPNDAHRQFIDLISDSLNAEAAIVHHRLSPEHAFPAAYDDVVAALDTIMASAGDKPVLAVADSSGGALLLSAMLERRSRGLANPAACTTLSALTDMAMTGLSHVANAEADPMFGPQAIIHKSAHYLRGANPTDPRASPFWAELSGLPPLLMFAGSTEVMLDDTVRFAEKADKSGVSITLRTITEAPHSFAYIPGLPEAAAATAEIISFFRTFVQRT